MRFLSSLCHSMAEAAAGQLTFRRFSPGGSSGGSFLRPLNFLTIHGGNLSELGGLKSQTRSEAMVVLTAQSL